MHISRFLKGADRRKVSEKCPIPSYALGNFPLSHRIMTPRALRIPHQDRSNPDTVVSSRARKADWLTDGPPWLEE